MDISKIKVTKVLADSLSQKNKKHPKCLGWYKNDVGMVDGPDWGCDYDTIIDCDECKYGHGNKNPEAKCNQPK